MSKEDFVRAEHAAGLHANIPLSFCPDCPRPEALPPPPEVVDARVPEPPLERIGTTQPLSSALRRLRSLIVVDQPDDPTQDLDRDPRWIDDDPYCTRCGGSRWVSQPTDGRIPLPWMKCPDCLTAPWAVQKRVTKLLGELPAGLRDLRLETFPTKLQTQRDLLVKMQRWLEDPDRPWLYLHGPTGVGKTGLAVALLFALSAKGWSTSFELTINLLSKIKATFGSADGEPGELDIVHALSTVDLCVIDDLGSEYHRGNNGGDWATEKIFQIVDRRYVDNARMIVTSNYSLDQIASILGHPRTSSRIHERCRGWIVDCRGLPDLRMRQVLRDAI